jgi:pilus assembly protein Flp/PilA
MSVIHRAMYHLFSIMNGELFEAEDGQALAEYGLILGLVAVVVIAAVTLIGTNLNTTLNTIANAI